MPTSISSEHKNAGNQEIGRSRSSAGDQNACITALDNNLRLILTGGENADISRAEALIKATSVQIVITNKDNNNHSL